MDKWVNGRNAKQSSSKNCQRLGDDQRASAKHAVRAKPQLLVNHQAPSAHTHRRSSTVWRRFSEQQVHPLRGCGFIRNPFLCFLEQPCEMLGMVDRRSFTAQQLGNQAPNWRHCNSLRHAVQTVLHESQISRGEGAQGGVLQCRQMPENISLESGVPRKQSSPANRLRVASPKRVAYMRPVAVKLD